MTQRPPIASPSPAASAVCALFALLAAACGGSRSAEPPPSTALAPAATNAPPPLPADPLKLLPGEVREILSVDLRALRGSPHYAVVEPWLRRFTCMQPEPAHFLLERTDRLVLATYGQGQEIASAQPLVIMRGDYRDGDVERALSQARAWLHAPSEPLTAEQRGRFKVEHAAALAGARLGDHLLAVGHPARVYAALDVADGKLRSFDTADALMRGIETGRWLDAHGIAAITRVDEQTARRIGSRLSMIGGRRLGENLSTSSAALALVLATDLELQAHVLYPDAQTAAAAADGLRGVLGRADLVLRLSGLPPTLDRAHVTAQGERLDASLKLTSSELQALSQRIAPLLDSATPACGALSAVPAPAAGARDALASGDAPPGGP